MCVGGPASPGSRSWGAAMAEEWGLEGMGRSSTNRGEVWGDKDMMSLTLLSV